MAKFDPLTAFSNYIYIVFSSLNVINMLLLSDIIVTNRKIKLLDFPKNSEEQAKYG